MKFYKHFIIVLTLALLACQPEEVKVEIYTSDIQGAQKGKLYEVPAVLKFSAVTEDILDSIEAVKKAMVKYLGEEGEIKVGESDFGKSLIVKMKIPLADSMNMGEFLLQNKRIAALWVEGNKVTFSTTPQITELNRELQKINFMLSIEFPAEHNILKLVGDLDDPPKINATAVFVDESAELIYQSKIEKRQSIEIDFRGGEGSVYSKIRPFFEIEF